MRLERRRKRELVKHTHRRRAVENRDGRWRQGGLSRSVIIAGPVDERPWNAAQQRQHDAR
jgi:hypothetical protein